MSANVSTQTTVYRTPLLGCLPVSKQSVHSSRTSSDDPWGNSAPVKFFVIFILQKQQSIENYEENKQVILEY